MSKLSTLVAALRAELAAGKYVSGGRFPSEYWIAGHYGVNKTTANKAVGVLVSEGLLSRGGRGAGTLVEQLQLFPVKQFTYIGLITHPYYASLFHGLQQAALAHHCLMNIIAPPAEQLCQYLPKLAAARISGIFSCSYGDIEAGSLPVIYLEENCVPAGKVHHCVTCNSFQGAYQMMRELLRRRHRNIVMLFRHGLAPRRLEGFCAALQEAGLADFQARIFRVYQEKSAFEGQHVLQKMLQKYPGLTAIAAASDDDIAMLIKAADQLGIPWRGKIAMTGFGNVKGISDLLPIATVDQHPQRIGQEAFLAMLNLSDNPERVVHEQLEVELLGLDQLPQPPP